VRQLEQSERVSVRLGEKALAHGSIEAPDDNRVEDGACIVERKPGQAARGSCARSSRCWASLS
jgi:hypothetical protein